jgi:hypothetical protein
MSKQNDGGNVVGGAVVGAGLGALIGGAPGAAVGAVIGGIAGACVDNEEEPKEYTMNGRFSGKIKEEE